jgi:hypothetical protein
MQSYPLIAATAILQVKPPSLANLIAATTKTTSLFAAASTFDNNSGSDVADREHQIHRRLKHQPWDAYAFSRRRDGNHREESQSRTGKQICLDGNRRAS